MTRPALPPPDPFASIGGWHLWACRCGAYWTIGPTFDESVPPPVVAHDIRTHYRDHGEIDEAAARARAANFSMGMLQVRTVIPRVIAASKMYRADLKRRTV